MLARESGQPLASLRTALAGVAEQCMREVVGLARVRVGLRVAPNPVRLIPHAKHVSARTFDAIVDVSTCIESRGTLERALEIIGHGIEKLVNRADTAAVAGVGHPITGGTGPCLLAYAIRRPAELSRDEWSQHWLTTHAQIGRDVPGLKAYLQLHARREDNEWAARAAGGLGLVDFDGVALTEYSGPDEFVETLSQREVVDVAINDEYQFIDPSRSTMTLVEITCDAMKRGSARGA
jgi:hypothetical protein